MKIALKEPQETRYWLRIIIASEILVDPEIEKLTQETNELVCILNSIISNTTKGMIE